MTITVLHEGRQYEWHVNGSSSTWWTSDVGNVVRSKRLIAKLEREARAVLERFRTSEGRRKGEYNEQA